MDGSGRVITTKFCYAEDKTDHAIVHHLKRFLNILTALRVGKDTTMHEMEIMKLVVYAFAYYSVWRTSSLRNTSKKNNRDHAEGLLKANIVVHSAYGEQKCLTW